MNKVFLFFTMGIFTLSCANAQEIKNVDSKEFSEIIKSGDGIILDVRTPQEYSQGHIKNSTLISTNDRDFVEKANLLQKDKPIYVYCLTGSRSRSAANYLSKNGFSKVYNLSRGIMEWQQYGYPVTKSTNQIASHSKTYNQAEFDKILNSKNVVLIDFQAPWCAPCKQMTPIIEKLQKDYTGKATIEKIDIVANKTIKDNYNIASIPGLILFKNGKEVWKHTGLISYVDLSKVINKYL
jgi:thioredoxin